MNGHSFCGLLVHKTCTIVGSMKTVADISEQLGRRDMERELGVTRAAIANAVSDGKFPASWYGIISSMCAEREIDCPLDAFRMREAADPTLGAPNSSAA